MLLLPLMRLLLLQPTACPAAAADAASDLAQASATASFSAAADLSVLQQPQLLLWRSGFDRAAIMHCRANALLEAEVHGCLATASLAQNPNEQSRSADPDEQSNL